MAKPKIYLHWSATHYEWRQPNHYHTIVSGAGDVCRIHDYNVDLGSHTYGRNRNSIALACACMGGADPWKMAPTAKQLEAMCSEVARIIKLWGWKESDINIQNIMTHAEAASNKDGVVMHDNYGPQEWGGTGERWDFLRLKKSGASDGGDQLRKLILTAFRDQQQPAGGTPAPGAAHPLEGAVSRTMQARATALQVLVDSQGTSWAKVSELLDRYDLPFLWDAAKRRILIGSQEIAPRYSENQVSVASGQPTFELALQGAASPVILVGLLFKGKGYCRVLEFADELGISATFNPFALHEMRGG